MRRAQAERRARADVRQRGARAEHVPHRRRLDPVQRHREHVVVRKIARGAARAPMLPAPPALLPPDEKCGRDSAPTHAQGEPRQLRLRSFQTPDCNANQLDQVVHCFDASTQCYAHAPSCVNLMNPARPRACPRWKVSKLSHLPPGRVFEFFVKGEDNIHVNVITLAVSFYLCPPTKLINYALSLSATQGGYSALRSPTPT